MIIVAQILIVFVALEHVYIAWMEMFAWTTRGRKAFRSLPPDMFEKTKVLAANQGLYNAFLAAGLFWSLFISNPEWSKNVAYFFLGCVILAGFYGSVTAAKSIFYIQAVPAILAFVAVLLFM